MAEEHVPMMKAFLELSYDKPLDMILGEIEIPQVGPNQIKIAVKAAALNPVDGLRIHLQSDKIFPVVVGFDVAGVVDDVGSAVSRFHVGDRVFGFNERTGIAPKTSGAVAEYCVVDADLMSILPENASFEEGAAVPIVLLTALQAMAGIKPGDRVFVSGGAGGVGIHALQIAKSHFGAKEVATTASTTKIKYCQQYADIVVDYKTEDAGKTLKGWADFVFDTTKEVATGKVILKEGGLIRSIADFSDQEISIFCQANHEQMEIVSNLLEKGKVKAMIDRVYPFEESMEAMEYQMSGRAMGKIIIKVSD